MKPSKHKNKQSFQLPKALNKNQLDLIQAILTKDMVITTGPAGTGKSYIPAAYAAYYYHQGKIDRIILTRPTVPVGKSIGFFPGTLEEKMAPWTQPFVSVLEKFLSKGEVDCMLKNERLEIVPFEVIRGRTFDASFVILDEAQNTSCAEIKAFVTRIGQGSKIVINGDTSQSDLLNNSKSGLSWLKEILERPENEELRNSCALISFFNSDIVRSPLCKLWVEALQ